MGDGTVAGGCVAEVVGDRGARGVEAVDALPTALRAVAADHDVAGAGRVSGAAARCRGLQPAVRVEVLPDGEDRRCGGEVDAELPRPGEDHRSAGDLHGRRPARPVVADVGRTRDAVHERVGRAGSGLQVSTALVVDRAVDPGGVHGAGDDAGIAHRDRRALKSEAHQDRVRVGADRRGLLTVLGLHPGEDGVRRTLGRCGQILVRSDDRALVGRAEVQLCGITGGGARRRRRDDEPCHHESQQRDDGERLPTRAGDTKTSQKRSAVLFSRRRQGAGLAVLRRHRGSLGFTRATTPPPKL